MFYPPIECGTEREMEDVKHDSENELQGFAKIFKSICKFEMIIDDWSSKMNFNQPIKSQTFILPNNSEFILEVFPQGIDESVRNEFVSARLENLSSTKKLANVTITANPTNSEDIKDEAIIFSHKG